MAQIRPVMVQQKQPTVQIRLVTSVYYYYPNSTVINITIYLTIGDSQVPLINKLKCALGIQNKSAGRKRKHNEDEHREAKLTRKRDTRYMRQITHELRSKLESSNISESDILQVLRWPQSKKCFPSLHAAVDTVGRAEAALEKSFRDGFDKIGRSHKQACTALFTKGLPMAQAMRVSGQKRKYIEKARSMDISESRLVTEDYPPKAKRQKIVDIEVTSTREHMEGRLYSKSGNHKSDTHFRYSPFKVLYHEDYRPE